MLIENEVILDYLFMLVIPGGQISAPMSRIQQFIPIDVMRSAEARGLINISRHGTTTHFSTVALTRVGRELVGLESTT